MENKNFINNIKVLTTASLLAAMSVVIGILCKTLLNFGNGLFRITFENLPIILSGIFFGPAVGAMVGFVSDLISYLLSFQSYPLNIVVTIGAASIGLVSGIVSKYLIKREGLTKVVAAVLISHLIGSVIIKSVGLFYYYGWAVLFRIPTYLLIGACEAALIWFLYNKTAFRRLIDEARKERV